LGLVIHGGYILNSILKTIKNFTKKLFKKANFEFLKNQKNNKVFLHFFFLDHGNLETIFHNILQLKKLHYSICIIFWIRATDFTIK